jgi:hypothetical protein
MPLKEHFSRRDDPRAQHSIEHLLLVAQQGDYVLALKGNQGDLH